MNTFLMGVESSQICPPGYITGARLAVTGVGTVTAGTVSVFSALRDSTNVFDIVWTGVLTGVLPTDLDTGSEIANIHYNVFVIGDTNLVNSPKVLFSESQTAPTMPSGYDVFRRIGTARNDGSKDLLIYIQFGEGNERSIVYKEDRSVLSVLTNGAATIFWNVNLLALVPPSSRLARILCNALMDHEEGFVEFRPKGSAFTDPPIKLQAGCSVASSLAAASLDFLIEVNGLGQFQYANDGTGNTIDLYCLGYMEFL